MKLSHNYYVYIVQCEDGFYYTGITTASKEELQNTIREKTFFLFIQKENCRFKKYFEHFKDVSQAIARKKQLKGWSRAKKEAWLKTMIC